MSNFHISSSAKKSKKTKSCAEESNVCTSSTPIVNYIVSNSGGNGSVTSIGLTMPSDVFSVTPSTITSSGIFNVLFNTQTANKVFAGPITGADAIPSFRILTASDVPVLSSLNGSLSLSQISQGGATLSQVLSWTGSTWGPISITGSISSGTATGQLLYWNGSAWVPISERTYKVSGITGTNITLPTLPVSSPALKLYINGIRKYESDDYTISSNTITILSFSLITSDKVIIDYYN